MSEEFNRETPMTEEEERSLKPIAVELLIIVVLAILATLTLNPYWMPMGLYLTTLLALTVLFALFAVLVWREQGGDERERLLIHMSDRIAFLTGATLLLIAVIVEGLIFHMTNPWVIGALAAMVIAKAGAYIYNSYKN